MQKQFDLRQYKDIKPWIILAVAEEDLHSDIRLWKKAPTSGDAIEERLRRIKFLRKHSKSEPAAIVVADRLESCEQGNRCLSGACPECGRLLQRWLVRRSQKFVGKYLDRPGQELVALSLVPCHLFSPEDLNRFSAENLQRRIKYALKETNIQVALGGIDFSFNEDRKEKYAPHWCPHVYLITTVEDRAGLRRQLRNFFPRGLATPKPVKISRFKNVAYRRSYAWKMRFKRRIGYDDIKLLDNGNYRKFRNCSKDELRASERLELFLALDQMGLASRVIFLGASPKRTPSGIRIRKIKKQ
jgi:hypothetical protein